MTLTRQTNSIRIIVILMVEMGSMVKMIAPETLMLRIWDSKHRKTMTVMPSDNDHHGDNHCNDDGADAGINLHQRYLEEVS